MKVVWKNAPCGNPSFGRSLLGFFNTDKVHKIKITFHEKDWKQLLSDIHENPRGEVFRKAFFSVYRSKFDSTPVSNWRIGIRISGNTASRRSPYVGDWENKKGRFYKPHWKISFVRRFDNSEQRRKGLFGVRGLKLKNFSTDRSYRDEIFCFDTFAQAGITVPRATWAQVVIAITNRGFITNVNYGLYKVFEPIDRAFVKKRFPAKKKKYGNLYKCLWQDHGPADLTIYSISNPRSIGREAPDRRYQPTYDLKNNKKRPDHAVLKSFIKNLNSRKGRDFESWIGKHFMVEEFLRVYAISVLSGMSDDYWVNGHNYYLYHDISSGKWVFLPYDYDSTMGAVSIKQGNCDRSHVSFRSIDRFGPTASHRSAGRKSGRPLINKLLAVPRFRRRYHRYIDYFIKNDFACSHAAKKYSKWGLLLKSRLGNDLGIPDRVGPVPLDYFHRRVFTAARQLGKNVRDYDIGRYRNNIRQTVFRTPLSDYPEVTILHPSVNRYHCFRVHLGKKWQRLPARVYTVTNRGHLKLVVSIRKSARSLTFYSWQEPKGITHRCIKQAKPGIHAFTFDLSTIDYSLHWVGVNVLNYKNKRVIAGFMVMKVRDDYRSPEIIRNRVVFRYRNIKINPAADRMYLNGSFFDNPLPTRTMRYNPEKRIWEISLRLKKGRYWYRFNKNRKLKIRDAANPHLANDTDLNSLLIVK